MSERNLRHAIQEFRSGKFVLLHDSGSRENEVDLVVAAEFVSPEHVRMMRTDAGGLVCVTVDHDVGERLGISFLQDVLISAAPTFPILREMAEAREPYGDKSAFSITINHRHTFTGITDHDRAITILQMAKLSKRVLENHTDSRREFAGQFKSPGHVYLLLESRGSLAQRRGHTELSLYLSRLAGLTPSTAICEMLDGKTYRALSLQDAQSYAKRHSLSVIDGEELLAHFLRSQEYPTLASVI
jgi:3,4-dihydroxy 2-butanone 4-phosphate synthase